MGKHWPNYQKSFKYCLFLAQTPFIEFTLDIWCHWNNLRDIGGAFTEFIHTISCETVSRLVLGMLMVLLQDSCIMFHAFGLAWGMFSELSQKFNALDLLKGYWQILLNSYCCDIEIVDP